MTEWALDLGTTNCAVACWDDSLCKPRLIELPAVCRPGASGASSGMPPGMCTRSEAAPGEEAQVAVPLNAASPTLGFLDPPHSPRDRRPRLEIAFGVSAERWLIATVRDLLTQRELLREEPVVRLV